MISHQREVRMARLLKLPCALQIGCGSNLKRGWVNVDFDEAADMRLDIREPLPLPGNSVTTIYSEHFFEHLSLQAGKRFLGECARVLIAVGLRARVFEFCAIQDRSFVRPIRDGTRISSRLGRPVPVEDR
jgi:predicted SAM-dependent methyltransferase